MAIPVLVRSVGPTPQGTSNYYTNWTQFVPGYPKFKNQDTGVSQALFSGSTLTAYRAHYLYFTGQTGQIVDRVVEFDVGQIPGVGEYYEIPVDVYEPGSTGLSPAPGSSQNTSQPSGPAILDVVVTESFALSTGDARVTDWRAPRSIRQLGSGTQHWLNKDGAKVRDEGVVASKTLEATDAYKLVAQDFGFTLPNTAKVLGVEVEIVRAGAGVTSERIELVYGGTWGQVIALAHHESPFVSVYPWSSVGFGEKFANPATLPPSIGEGVAFHPARNALAVAHFNSPFISAYQWSGSGFGEKFADPATLPAGTGFGVAFSPTGDALAVVHDSAPFVSAYPWSASGLGVKHANPATLPGGHGRRVAFSPAGDALAVAHLTSPFVSVYPWSGAGFGTKFSDPSTLPVGTGFGVAFSPSGDALAVTHNSSPFVSVYPWSGAGFGTKFADPSTLPAGTGFGVAFSPTGDALALAHNASPFVSAYRWSGSGFGSKFTNPSTLPGGNGRGVAFSPNGDALAVAHNGAPFVSAYSWSGAGFGAKFSDPATPPGGVAAWDVVFSEA